MEPFSFHRPMVVLKTIKGFVEIAKIKTTNLKWAGALEFIIYYLRSIPVRLEIAIWLQTFFLWNSKLSVLGTVECFIGQFCRRHVEFKNTPINSPIKMMQFQRIHRLTNESLFLVVFVATSSGQIQPRIDFNKLLFANVPEFIGRNKYAFLNGTQRILGWIPLLPKRNFSHILSSRPCTTIFCQTKLFLWCEILWPSGPYQRNLSAQNFLRLC